MSAPKGPCARGEAAAIPQELRGAPKREEGLVESGALHQIQGETLFT
jgi:hypothetical protein